MGPEDPRFFPRVQWLAGGPLTGPGGVASSSLGCPLWVGVFTQGRPCPSMQPTTGCRLFSRLSSQSAMSPPAVAYDIPEEVRGAAPERTQGLGVPPETL